MGKQDKTDEDTLEIMCLSDELNALAVSRTHPNPYFEQFANAMAKRVPEPEQTLSRQDIEAQTKLAEDILAEILAEEKAALEGEP